MLRSFTGLTFCLVNSTKISNPVYEKDTVDIALSLKAILSGIFLSNFSEMESAVQAYWLFPLGTKYFLYNSLKYFIGVL